VADKIAISVEHDLLEAVEALRRKTGESRSALFARAARLLLQAAGKQRAIEAYVEGYRRHPETEAEVDQAAALARSSLPAVTWDE
jgi:metal-responsive CopG/Arc/MetJ family transcriptional regulator